MTPAIMLLALHRARASRSAPRLPPPPGNMWTPNFLPQRRFFSSLSSFLCKIEQAIACLFFMFDFSFAFMFLCFFFLVMQCLQYRFFPGGLDIPRMLSGARIDFEFLFLILSPSYFSFPTVSLSFFLSLYYISFLPHSPSIFFCYFSFTCPFLLLLSFFLSLHRKFYKINPALHEYQLSCNKI